MNLRTASFASLLLLASLGLAPTPGFAQTTAGDERQAALSSQGDIYLAQLGTCRELFARCAPGTERNRVLALDVVRSTSNTERHLVPTSLGPEVEATPALLIEDATQSVFVVWESRLSGSSSRINLVSFRNGAWGEATEITGAIAPLKGTPHLALTRDHYTTAGSGGQGVVHARSTLHIVWWEKTGYGEQVFYTPIVLVDGNYLGANHVYNLSLFDPSPIASDPVRVAPSLAHAVRIEPGRDAHSVVIGFVNPQTQRLLTFEVRVVIGELSELGDLIQLSILASGDLYRSNPNALADRIRSHIVELGFRLHPALVSYLAQQIPAAVPGLATTYRDNLPALADRIRSHIVELGTRSFGNTGVAENDPDRGGVLVLPSPNGNDISHAIWLRLVAQLPLPIVPQDAQVNLMLASNARKLAVTWKSDASFYYRESDETEWTVARHLDLGNVITLEVAHRLVYQRLRSH
jgi:hypothetical protein